MLATGKPLQPSFKQHSSLLGQYVSYKENEVLLNSNPDALSKQHFIFIVTDKQAQYVRVFATGKPFQPCFKQHSSLFGQFISCAENEALVEFQPRDRIHTSFSS